MSKSKIKEEIQASRSLTAETKEAIRNTPLADNKTDLLE
jgi:hypothetical protein